MRFRRQRTRAQSKETLDSSLLLSHGQPLRLSFEAWLFNRQWGNEITIPERGQPLALTVFFCFIRRWRSIWLGSGQTGLSERLWGKSSLLVLLLLPVALELGHTKTGSVMQPQNVAVLFARHQNTGQHEGKKIKGCVFRLFPLERMASSHWSSTHPLSHPTPCQARTTR